jgi:hypothetical protein
MVAAVAGICTECLETHYNLNGAGVCGYCRRFQRGTTPPPPWPTRHLPGSEEKVIVMEWRAQNGYAVLHPLDATEDPRGSIDTGRYPVRNHHLDLPIYRTYATAT